jgi:mannose-6-phosphate isomerase class I
LASNLPGLKGTEVLGLPLSQLVSGDLPLVKVLDSSQALSVQLHPDDALAHKFHGPGFRGKWESWFFLRAPFEGFVYLGLEEGVEVADLFATIRAGKNPEPLLGKVHVEEGQSLAIRPGTIHALTQGAVVVEVQTASDLTYRLHDWDRLGINGKPRELHLEYSREAVGLAPPLPMATPPIPVTGEPGRSLLAACGPLHVEHLTGAHGPVCLKGECTRHPMVFVGVQGACELRSRQQAWAPERLQKGDCVVVPAASGEVLVGGPGELILGWLD